VCSRGARANVDGCARCSRAQNFASERKTSMMIEDLQRQQEELTKRIELVRSYL
jgi:hypothetical protein